MKMFKKFLSILCAACLFLAMAVPAFATTTEPPTVEKYAHMSLEGASQELAEKILDSRWELVYGHQAWTVNGAVSIRHEDGTIEQLPEFSELFPGWDLAEISRHGAQTVAVFPNSLSAPISPRAIGYHGTISLAMPISGKNTKPFYYFNGTGEEIVTWAETIAAPESQKYFNVGYTNEDIPDPKTGLGTDIGWIPDIPVNSKIAFLSTEDGTRYGVRASASAFGVPGSAYVHVETNS